MKIAVILENAPDCELDRKEVEVPNGDEDAIHAAVEDAILPWLLSVGDTIRIIEVPQ